VRFLLVNNHCISDPTAGLTQSLRTLMQWLSEAGHACAVLTTARFETPVSFTIEEHLSSLGVELPAKDHLAESQTVPRPVVHYVVSGVPVTLLMTRHNSERDPDLAEAQQLVALLAALLTDFAPDVLIACNGHPAIFASLAEARRRGIATAFAVRGYGYYNRRYFEHVDHVFTCSRFLTDFYHQRLGLESTPLEPPIDWSTVLAPEGCREFVTFVHPALHKGVTLFARLAAMLGSRRPDIPVLVIQSGRTAGILNAIPGIDFSSSPQIMAAPAVATPAEYFALTRLLLVPSVWPEPFGRVAAEAMINGIPPIVSDRGALPEVVKGYTGGDGGRILPLPGWMTPERIEVPSEDEVEPWYRAVCHIWDDDREYAVLGGNGRVIARERYSEVVSRRNHVDYFTGLEPGASPF
jgi:glycosyltransferase involved in cell wall biosynthesis